MPRPRREANAVGDAAEALSRVAPLTATWVERILAAHAPPLTPAQYLALTSIAGGDVFGADLARRAAVSPAAVSQLLAGLETSGLIERARPAGDRRRQTLALSEQGSLVLDSARALLRSRLGELLGELPAPEIHALTRLLADVEALLAGTAPPRRPHPPHRRR